MSSEELASFKQRVRTMWATGSYDEVARRQIWPVGERLVRRLDIGPDDDVLDVACGTGNAALRAAEAGARVVGVDLTPELLQVGRASAAAAGLTVDWREGDAEALPVGDRSFDAVVSVFGVIFAPRHRVAAVELVRVVRPGARMGLTAWTPEGAMADFFQTMSRYMPPPPEFVEPPILWGSEDHVRQLFEDTGMGLQFDRDSVQFSREESVDEEIEFSLAKFGPTMMAKAILEPQGRWEALRNDIAALIERNPPAEYLVILGRKP